MVRQDLPKFDYKKYREHLISIFKEVDKVENITWDKLRKILTRNAKPEGGVFSKSNLIEGYRKLLIEGEFNVPTSPGFIEKIKMKPVRTQSGVTPVTVLTKPFPCPGGCIFCPNDPTMPKSYMADEPGAQRAFRNKFDPYMQTFNRLEALDAIGHQVDKVELIILGGTWSYYPEKYQIWFVKRCFEAINDFGEGRDKPTNFITNAREQISTWEELFTEHKRNETAKYKCSGLVVETRPDNISPEEVIRIRKLGSTKTQIGFQSLNDEVLELNKRGHNVEATRRAVKLLREGGFKIHAHWMANLYGSTPEEDIQDFKKVFDDPDFRPDELKIYPCSLVESAELMRYYEDGLWRPYEQEELLEVLVEVVKKTPEYCRLTRVIRDIPSTDIVVGNKLTNFRELVDLEVKKRGLVSREIRSREVKNSVIQKEDLKLKITDYETSIGLEKFLQFVTEDEKIAGFLRLSLPKNPNYKHPFINELDNSSMIREIHVYGNVVSVGSKLEGKAQHLGLGKELIEKAKQISTELGYQKMAVISAVGTREYYRKRGFEDGELYQFITL